MPPPPRRLTMLDAMVMIAATAAGLALLRMTWPQYWPNYGYSWPPAGMPASSYFESAARQAIGAGPPVVLPLTLGYLAIRLRGPRPALRRLARQPGTAACLASIPPLTMVSAAYSGVNSIPGRTLELWSAMILLAYLVGPAVAGSWATLVISGQWRSPRGWVEALGLSIGAGWVALTLLALYSLRR